VDRVPGLRLGRVGRPPLTESVDPAPPLADPPAAPVTALAGSGHAAAFLVFPSSAARGTGEGTSVRRLTGTHRRLPWGRTWKSECPGAVGAAQGVGQARAGGL